MRNRYKSKETNMVELSDLFTDIKLDTNFQRWFRWKPKRCKSFFDSLVKGLANTSIKVVDVNKALEHALDKNDTESIRYYSKAQKVGYKYISIDGNSRTTFNALFAKGFEPNIVNNIQGPVDYDKSFKLNYKWDCDDFVGYDELKDFSVLLSNMIKVKNESETFPKFALYQISSKFNIKKAGLCKYNGSDKKIKLSDDDIKVLIDAYKFITRTITYNLEVWEDLSRSELHQLFINYNLSEKIEDQDIRNAKICGMSTIVRNMPKNVKNLLEDHYHSPALLKRTHHEMFGFCMMYLKKQSELKRNSTKFTGSQLNKFWDYDRPDTLTSDERKIWNIFVKLARVQSRSARSKALMLDMFAYAMWLHQNNISISIIDSFGEAIEDEDDDLGWQQLMKLHTEWMDEQMKRGDIYKVSKGYGDFSAFRGGISYFTHSSGEWAESWESFLDDKLDEGYELFIQKEKRDPKVNTASIREILWNRQGGVDPQTGKKIPYKSVFNTDRKNGGYEVHHEVSLELGGTNDIENLQLICGVENAKIGYKTENSA